MTLAQPAGLAALERRLAYELECLQLPAARWTRPVQHAGESVADVGIVGGGMAGLALAAALHLKGIVTLVLDESPEGFEGPWATTARMETLRSPKQLAGPALGLPSLTFRAWFEAQFGSAAWAELDKIPRLQWMDYLRWYRRALGLQVHNRQRVIDVWPQGDGVVRLRVEDLAPGEPAAGAGAAGHAASSARPPVRDVHVRHLVLATGRDGLGGPWVPAWVRTLPRDRWVHSGEAFDYARLKGRRVGVVGAGASAMDSAATALEEGAARVHLLVRRPDIPRINKGKGGGNPGFVYGHARLSDEWKWRLRRYIHEQQVPPPRNSTLRVARHANAFFHLDCAALGAREQGGALRVETARGPIALDFLILATGFRLDWAQRPMLRHIAPHVRQWQDRFTPPAGMEDAELSESPDLGPCYEFQPRTPGACPGLERVHCFCYPAALSMGVITGDIPAISEGATQLATLLAMQFHAEDIEHQFARMRAYAEPEVFGDEWQAVPLPPYDEGDAPT